MWNRSTLHGIDMIEKEVILFVRGEQQFDGVDPDQTELISEGVMTIADDGTIGLSYEETELTGMEGTTTSFTIQGDTVTLTRTGAVTSQMVFQPGQPHSSLYNTPWGALTVDITTSRVAHRLTERGGIIDIRFSISVEHQATGSNHFHIRVREKMR